MGSNEPTPQGCPKWIFTGGAVALLVAAAGALMLSISRFAGAWLPGCGPGGGCDRAADSAWGSVPLLGWPTSSAGLAYFLAMLVAWIMARGALPEPFRWTARLGAVMSIMFIVVMVAGGYVCTYCLVSHIGNFVFVGLAELSRRTAPARAPVLAAAGITFLVTTGVLGIIEVVQGDAIRERAERELAESTEQITGTGERRAFTGRYRTGPANAAIRVVVFSDYQCKDCKKIEGDLARIMAERDDVSLSVKHFPFCTDCNHHMSSNPHPNACWAARAAETAGILGGDEGFFRMHQWLFEQGGGFTADSLRPALIQMGFDPGEFFAIMQDESRTIPQIKADIDEAKSLGLYFTPMIFVNGVELKGFTAPDAVRRTIEAVATTSPKPAPADTDRPPTAEEKYVDDWRDSPALRAGTDVRTWPLGPEDAAVRIELFSDLTEPGTVEALSDLRAVMADRGDVRLDFRHYPADSSCNPTMTKTVRPDGCIAAQAVEAAGILGGGEAYWAMIGWVTENREALSEDAIREAAAVLGLDADALLAEMASQDVAQGIRIDAQAGKRHRLRSIPAVVVNDKFVPRWRLEGTDIMRQIVQEAAGR